MLTNVVSSHGTVRAASRQPSWMSTTGWPWCRTVSAEPPRGSVANASATALKAGSNEPSMWRTVVAGRPVLWFPGADLGRRETLVPDLEPEEGRGNVFRAGRDADNQTERSAVAVLPNPSNFGPQSCCVPGPGEVLGQMGWNREKPVDTVQKA